MFELEVLINAEVLHVRLMLVLGIVSFLDVAGARASLARLGGLHCCSVSVCCLLPVLYTF